MDRETLREKILMYFMTYGTIITEVFYMLHKNRTYVSKLITEMEERGLLAEKKLLVKDRGKKHYLRYKVITRTGVEYTKSHFMSNHPWLKFLPSPIPKFTMTTTTNQNMLIRNLKSISAAIIFEQFGIESSNGKRKTYYTGKSINFFDMVKTAQSGYSHYCGYSLNNHKSDLGTNKYFHAIDIASYFKLSADDVAQNKFHQHIGILSTNNSLFFIYDAKPEGLCLSIEGFSRMQYASEKNFRDYIHSMYPMQQMNTVTYQIDGTGEFVSDAPTFTEVGTHTVTVKVSGGDNYNELTQSVVVSLTEMEQVPNIAVTPYGGTNGVVYDKNTHNAVTVDGTDEGDTVTYSLDSEDETNAIPQITNAGTYNITVKIERDGYAPYTTSVTAKINKAVAAITADDTQSATYDGTAKNITASLNHDETTLAYSQNDMINADTYTVTASAAGTTNYLPINKIITFTIQKADITGVTITGYSGAANGNDYGVTVTGAERYTITYKSDNATEFTSVAPTFTEGTHTVTVKLSGDNYNDLEETVTISLTKEEQPSEHKYITPLGDFNDKLIIEKVIDSDNRINLIISSKNGEPVEPFTLYTAVYNSQGVLVRVVPNVYNEDDSEVIVPVLEPQLLEGETSYKLMLWNMSQMPIITAITRETNFLSDM